MKYNCVYSTSFEVEASSQEDAQSKAAELINDNVVPELVDVMLVEDFESDVFQHVIPIEAPDFKRCQCGNLIVLGHVFGAEICAICEMQTLLPMVLENKADNEHTTKGVIV